MHALDSEVVDLLKDLVSIDSVNPDLSPGARGEADIAMFVHRWAVENGLSAELAGQDNLRPSVLVRGGERQLDAPRLLLCAHLDTVGIGEMVDPLIPRVEGDRLYGRGSYDMKAGLAASLIACRQLDRQGYPGEVIVAAVADEEHGSLGVRAVLGAVDVDLAIVTEPTELVIGVAHRGYAWMEVEVLGVAAHGSRPHLGVDAICKMGPILVALEQLGEQLGQEEDPLLGPPVLHAGTVTGGTETSTIPERCVLTVERRTVAGETLETVEQEIESLLSKCRLADPALQVSWRTLEYRPGMRTDLDEPLVRSLAAAHLSVRGTAAESGGMSYWADSALIAQTGVPTVLFGPGGEGAHATVEWVSLSDTVDCVGILTATAEVLLRDS
jgi:acetylornithine deacetylase